MGKLYLTPTPIGNLKDISDRVREALKGVAIIACEDTRTTGKLLSLLGIRAKLISYHEYNESIRAPRLVEHLMRGEDVAVVSDAGAPGISDPSYRVIKAAISAGAQIVALPGPCAIIPALTASGLPTDRFFFEGFLPRTTATRKRRFAELATNPHTLVFYESPHRIAKAVSDALETLGDRDACVAREISKIHEEFLRGTLSELKSTLEKRKIKGEIVLLITGAPKEAKAKKNKYKK